MSDIELVKNQILASKPLFIAHPGGSKLSEFYPNASNCTSHAAEALNQHGAYRVSFNQAVFGGTQTAIVSCSSLLNNMAIAMVVTPAANTAVSIDPGWGFQVIDRIEFSFSNSLLQDVTIPGPLLREYALYLCSDEKERAQLLDTAGEAFNGVSYGGVVAHTALVPLNFLSFIGTNHSFPLDLSVLSSGTVQIRVTTRALTQIFLDIAAAGLGAVAFNSMDVVTSTSTLLQSAFSVRNAMIEMPEMIYSLPSKYMNYYQYAIAAGTNPVANAQTFQLASVPSGQLEAMFIVVLRNRDAADPEQTASTQSAACSFESLSLTYGSQTIYDSRSYEERSYYLKSVFDDDLKYIEHGWRESLAANNTTPSFSEKQIAVIPFMHRGHAVKSGAFMENVPNYGGAQLSLTFRLRPIRKLALCSTGGIAAANLPTATPLFINGAAANGYTIYVGYLMSSILMIANGVIDLQL